MQITDDLYYVGVNDHDITQFEHQFDVTENGMAYNSYVILDEKIAICDTIAEGFQDIWLANLEEVLGDRTPDYLIVHHMEPDHSANIDSFIEKYPNVQIVSSMQSFRMMDNFFETDYADQRIIVKEGDTLSLGSHTLTFVAAPQVHWPEVMFSYDDKIKTLFSADAFGKFGANDVEDNWVDEARRYYFAIVGKFGKNAQNALAKAANLEIERICPLHGPVLDKDLEKYLSLYDIWSKYEPEDEGVALIYSSVYNHTEEAVLKLADILANRGCKVSVSNLAGHDVTYAIAEAFRYNKVVLATTTYNMGIFPLMENFLNGLAKRNYQNRTVALIENGMWAPLAAKGMAAHLEKMKDITILDEKVTLKGSMTEDDVKELEKLADALLA